MAEELVRKALGDQYDYVVWGKVFQQVYRETDDEGERGTLTVDQVLEQYILPEQERLDNLERLRRMQRGI